MSEASVGVEESSSEDDDALMDVEFNQDPAPFLKDLGLVRGLGEDDSP
jgi:hypothetical protein